MSIFRRNPATAPLLVPPAAAPALTLTQAGTAAIEQHADRAPRLTDKLLSKDLPLLLEVAAAEIEYLDERLASTGLNAVNEKLKARFKDKREGLARARTWLEGKIAAETGRRGGA